MGTMYLINASSGVTEVTDRSLSGKEIQYNLVQMNSWRWLYNDH